MSAILGYAYQDEHGELHIRTVEETQRGAKVNALVAALQIWVGPSHSDDDIDQLFEHHRPHGAEIVKVMVTEA